MKSPTISKPMNPITKNKDGTVTWDSLPGDRYLATGVLRNGKRFRGITGTYQTVRNINLWRGTKWLLRNGKRYKLQSVYN
jgi:hypothetical protein